jgi:hypothetical protein
LAQVSGTTELLDMWPEMDERGGLAWRDTHPNTFSSLVRLAKRATAAGRTVSITALQDALVLAGPAATAHFPTPPPTPADSAGRASAARPAAEPEDVPLPPGLPIPPKSTAPYVARLVAQCLPCETQNLVLEKAGNCPFCTRCRDDVPAAGEVVNTDVVLLKPSKGRGSLGFRRGAMVRPPTFAANDLASLNELDLQERRDGKDSVAALLASLDATAAADTAHDDGEPSPLRKSCTWLARNIEQRFPTLRPGVQTHTTSNGGLFQAWEVRQPHDA